VADPPSNRLGERAHERPVAIADLAGLVNLSPSHFARMFLRTLGMTRIGGCSRRRIERARR